MMKGRARVAKATAVVTVGALLGSLEVFRFVKELVFDEIGCSDVVFSSGMRRSGRRGYQQDI